MARINIPPLHVSRLECRTQIDSWANGESMENADRDQRERHNTKFLKATFKRFQNEIMEYYRAGDTLEDQFQRLEEIRQALTEIGFTDGEKIYTIAPNIDSELRKTCPQGLRCVCGTCQ
jgi:hypothetical protein